MAQMIPNDINQFETDGEGAFYKFLEAHAKPNNKYVVWYSPDIEDREPDFILWSAGLGLLILEVKDWALDQILDVHKEYFVIRKGRKISEEPNPLEQARDYRLSLIKKMRADGKLVSNNPSHHGNPKIPINQGVVFPNIRRTEYIRRGRLKDQIRPDKVFFLDDLHWGSDICRDETGECFLERIKSMFSLMFRFTLTPREYERLKYLIDPDSGIKEPKRSLIGYPEHSEQIRVLDDHQEQLAKKYDGGHRIIKGPSGSGKTVILVHKARYLKKYNPVIKRILFVCYNIMLVNYIKRLLSDRGVGLGENAVEVYHFFELCSKILDEDIDYEKEDQEFYDWVVEETLSRIDNKNIKYDAILVDEGQDFSDGMYQVLRKLLNENTNNLTIVLDEDQNLYRRKLSWKELGVQARGRTHPLPHVYRNTVEIALFANRLLGKDNRQEESAQLELIPHSYDFHGPAPEIKLLPSVEEIVSYAANKIEYLVKEEEYPFSEIAIIYARRSFKDLEISSLPKMFGQALNSKGIMYYWASEDYQSKRSYDITTNSVTISTIHSGKGFDYACVFLVGMDLMEPGGWTKQQIRNMANVAITRARYQLFIPYTKENDLISRLLSCLSPIR